ncbi:transmembrane signal receptor [Lithospermum erythrorhizon]|uniref:Transmembrane signal receptor n=1 Tax=Lithospermum erythrorhizon TaxID=34254 RepID=A0AAV3PJN6_LITER
MKAKITTLDANETWELVDLPAHKKSIGCRWIYKVKYKADDTIDKYKTRLVAKGYNQIEGIDYFEIFNPVIKTLIVRFLLDMTSMKQWHLHQFDVNNAFLHDFLDEQSYHDNCLFVLDDGKRFMVLVVYVDDILIAGPSLEHIEVVKAFLHDKFTIKNIGEAKYFLGIQNARLELGMYLTQRKYATDIVKHLKMENCTAVATPFQTDWQAHDLSSFLLEDPSKYKSILLRINGMLHYMLLSILRAVHNMVCFMLLRQISSCKPFMMLTGPSARSHEDQLVDIASC